MTKKHVTQLKADILTRKGMDDPAEAQLSLFDLQAIAEWLTQHGDVLDLSDKRTTGGVEVQWFEGTVLHSYQIRRPTLIIPPED